MAHIGPRNGMIRLWAVALVACALVFHASASSAKSMDVDAELFLAVDVSRSMTARELEIQRRGYAEALVSDDVITAIRRGLHGKIAVTYVEWSGPQMQRVIVDWTVLATAEDARTFALKLTSQFNEAMRRTSISGAMDYASRSLDDNSFVSNRRIIDISGDGPNNVGRPVLEARAAALAKGIVINGLPLMTREGIGHRWHLENLDEYYRHCVIGGPSAFVIPVLRWEEFPAAVRQKLVLELAGSMPDPTRVMRIKAAPAYDCLIGEKLWQRIRQQWQP